MTKDNYEAWNISEKEFPKNSTVEEQVKYITRFGVLAASTHNTQPWRFRIESNVLKIFPDFDVRLPQTDPYDRNLYISLGCFVRNVECSAAYFRFTTEMNVVSEKDGVGIYVSFRKNEDADEELAELFHYIPKRFSNKMRYENTPIEKSILDRISKPAIKDIKGVFVENPGVIEKIAQIHCQSIEALAGNSDFAKELVTWLRPNDTEEFDGMPGFVVGLSDEQSLSIRDAIAKDPSMFKQMAQMDMNLILSSPVVGIVASPSDEVKSWIDIGRAYGTISLRAISFGLSITPLQAMVENKVSREKLGGLLGLKSTKPQIFFRLGYSKVEPYHTPRDLKGILE